MKKAGMNWKKLVFFSSVMTWLMAGTAAAANPGDVICSEVNEENIVLYVQNPGEIENIECQIGTVSCGDISYGAISEQEVPVSTLLLMDNSLSVSKEYRPMIGEIMNNIVANRMAGEQFTVATFSDKVTYLLEDSSDYAQLKQTIDGIEYADQETYLTDVLYEILNDWKQNPEPGYKRIVVVSDGVDNKAIGYTKEELNELIKEQPYPIYSMGCTYKNGSNNEELENMFALSRATNASYWLLDDVSDAMTVVSGVAEGNDVVRVEVKVPAEVCDGTDKGVKLTMQAGSETKETSTVVEMPFAVVETVTAVETKPEPVVEEPEAAEETEVEETEETAEEEKSGVFGGILKNPKLLVLGGIAVVALGGAAAAVIVLINILKKKKEDEKFEVAPEGAFSRAAEPAPANPVIPDRTEYAGNMMSDGDNTAMVWPGAAKTRMLIITDVKYPARRFETPINGTVVIGRSREDGCQVVIDYDKSVSRRHCQICLDGNQLKVKDLGSRNKTFLGEDRELIGEVEISSGSILKLGNVKVKVELRG